MSTEQNQAIILQFYKAFDNRNIEQALALLAHNFVESSDYLECGNFQ